MNIRYFSGIALLIHKCITKCIFVYNMSSKFNTNILLPLNYLNVNFKGYIFIHMLACDITH